MARIVGIDIPNEKRIVVSLTYIYGIGPSTASKILAAVGISEDIRTKDLTDEQLTALRAEVAKYHLEGDLRREVSLNIKRLCERIPEKRKVAKDRLDSDFWGLRVITKERVSDGRRNDLAYGVVVTLHEINGVNRIDEFESACLANGWLVNRVNVTERVEIHNKAEEEIHFES